MAVRCAAFVFAGMIFGAQACADNMMDLDPGAAVFLSAVPSGGAVDVAVEGPITLRFSGPMMAGMERYVDLHRGGLSDPTTPMQCAWSSDRATLTCRPDSPMERRTRYTLHMGGGLRDAAGRRIDTEQHRGHMGGEWADSARTGGMHSMMRMGDMPDGWRHPNGSVGMTFEFQTS